MAMVCIFMVTQLIIESILLGWPQASAVYPFLMLGLSQVEEPQPPLPSSSSERGTAANP